MRAHVMIVALALGLLAVGRAHGVEIVVIVHPDNPVSLLTRNQVSDLFLKKERRWSHGAHTEPVDLALEVPGREAFSQAYLQRSASSVQSYWQRKIFSGRDVPPPVRANDAEVIAFVRERPGAIGYVDRASATDRVKVIAIDVR